MANFVPITTQEEFDAAIGERLKRENAKYSGYMSPDDVAKKYSGYLSPDEVSKKYGGYLSPEDVEKKYKGFISPEEAAQKDALIKGYETSSVKMRIANETGIPYELAERLSGDNEDDIRKDAQTLAQFIKKKEEPAPGRSTEPGGEAKGGNNRAAIQKMLQEMKGE